MFQTFMLIHGMQRVLLRIVDKVIAAGMIQLGVLVR